jgi:hypothetical protein
MCRCRAALKIVRSSSAPKMGAQLKPDPVKARHRGAAEVEQREPQTSSVPPVGPFAASTVTVGQYGIGGH